MAAALAGRTDLIELLIQAGAHVSAVSTDGKTALYYAFRHGHDPVAERLLAVGAEIRCCGETLEDVLLEAAQWSDTGLAEILLKRGAHVDARDLKYGNTPLFWACYRGRAELVELFLRSSADVNATNKFGNTPLFWAARKGLTKIVKILLDHGADVHATDRDGKTALMVAAGAGALSVVALLINSGADMNAKTSFGWTAIMNAYFEGHAEIVAYLKRRGANLDGFMKSRAGRATDTIHRFGAGG
jgi:ankyrin repeat-rich membrane spanning protein